MSLWDLQQQIYDAIPAWLVVPWVVLCVVLILIATRGRRK